MPSACDAFVPLALVPLDAAGTPTPTSAVAEMLEAAALTVPMLSLLPLLLVIFSASLTSMSV